MEKVRALLYTSQLPPSLWGEVLRHSTWLKNRTSTQALGRNITPWQALYSSPPNCQTERFGETVWVHNGSGSKLEACVLEEKWLGFNLDSHAHWVTGLGT